mgnify:CR=1 FL=1
MDVTAVAERMLSLLGYPRIARPLVDRLDDGTTLEAAASAGIAPGCLLRGDVTLESNARLSTRCVLNGTITVGRGTNFEPACTLIGDVEFGNYCAIARENTFQQTNHETAKPSMQRRLYETVLDSDLEYVTDGPITVGNDVWIGARCIVLSGVTIGDGAVVAAGSVVTDDVEPYAVVGGVPAERLKWRFPREVREALQDLAWWNWDEETIRANRGFFERELESADDVPDVGNRSRPEPVSKP